MKIMAMTTKQGTACAETSLIDGEDTPEMRSKIEAECCLGREDDPVPGSWCDCTANEALWDKTFPENV